MLRTLPVLFALFAAPAFASNQVITVGPQPTADFAELQVAVNAASDGDILLVRAGVYVPTTIDAKGLTIIGVASPERPRVIQLTIRNIAATQTVVVRGLDTHGVIFSSPYFVSIDHCLGAITFEDCALNPSGGFWPFLPGGQPLIRVESCAHVAFSRCTMSPPSPSPMDSVASMALRVASSEVAVYDSKITGGSGLDAAIVFGKAGTAGGAAVELASGSLLLAGCVVLGGMGGDGAFTTGNPCLAAADGGAGIVATGGVVRLLDTFVHGGLGGATLGPCPGNPKPGSTSVVTGGSIATIAEKLRRFEISSPAFESGSQSVVFKGTVGEPVLLLMSTSVRNAYFPGMLGMLQPAGPFITKSLGIVPPTGQIAITVPMPLSLLPAGIEGINLFEQCVVPGNSGLGLLSTPSTQTVVRAGM